MLRLQLSLLLALVVLTSASCGGDNATPSGAHEFGLRPSYLPSNAAISYTTHSHGPGVQQVVISIAGLTSVEAVDWFSTPVSSVAFAAAMDDSNLCLVSTNERLDQVEGWSCRSLANVEPLVLNGVDAVGIAGLPQNALYAITSDERLVGKVHDGLVVFDRAGEQPDEEVLILDGDGQVIAGVAVPPIG